MDSYGLLHFNVTQIFIESKHRLGMSNKPQFIGSIYYCIAVYLI